jgi:signal transduction histidine kinase
MNVLNWGIRPETPLYVRSHLRLTNGLTLFLMAGSAIEATLLLLGGARQAAMFNSTAFPLFGACLLLMRAGHTRLARMILVTGGIAGCFWISSQTGFEPQLYIMLLWGSICSVFLFPPEDKRSIAYCFVLSLAAYYALELNRFQPLAGHPERLMPEAARHVRMTVYSLCWVLFFACVSFFVRSMHRYQQGLVEAAKMAALGRMAAGISHEINNPLTIVMNHAEQLAALPARPGARLEDVRPIAEGLVKMVDRMAHVIHGLTAFARDAAGEPISEVDVARMIQQTLLFCEAQIRSGGVRLEVATGDRAGRCLGREIEISQVLLNLVNNAVDAVLEQGDPARRWIRVEAARRGDRVEIAVVDGGAGIDPARARQVFDPFYTTKPVGKGTGLGLSISRSLVEGQGGELVLEPGSPTRFVARLRAAPGAAVSAPLAAAAGPAADRPRL